MKRSRFSDEQIIGVLREHDESAKVSELCRQAQDVVDDILRLEGEVWPHGRLRREAA